MISRLKIQSKLLLINTVCTLVVFTCAGLFWLLTSYWQGQENFEQRINSQAILVSSNVLAAVLFEDQDSARNILSALSSDAAIYSASISIPGETLAAITFRPASESTDFSLLAFFFDHHHLRPFEQPIVDDGNALGQLAVIAHDGELHKAFGNSALSILLLTIFSILLGGYLANRIQRLVTQPLKSLSGTARQVMVSKNYGLRGERFYDDEVGELTDDFNAMLDIIERRDQELETQVTERTRQLEQRNTQLLQQVHARRKSEQSRRESEQRFKQAFFKAPIGMALVDAEGRIFLRNQLFNQLLDVGLDEELELKGIKVADDFDVLETHFNQLKHRQVDSCEFEIDCEVNDGETLSAIVSMASVVDDEQFFRYAVLQMQDVTEARKLSEKLRYQADHDALTGLPNRRLMRQSLQQLIDGKSPEQGEQHTLCMLDLDRFKAVNDACGHAAGDELLIQVSELLLEHVHSDDLVARLGGDEFAILLYNCNVQQAQVITEKVRLAIEQVEFNWSGVPFRIGVSIGVAPIMDSDTDISELLQRADVACFAAKNAGRNRVYTVEHGDIGVAHRQGEMRWAQRLHEALEHQHFALFIQKVMPLQQPDRAERIEVLLRLRNQDDGSFIPPSEFLPAAERYGLCSKIDSWVMENLIQYLQHSQLLEDDHSYWINLSGQSLGDDQFLDYLEQTIRDLELTPGKLNFEITETALIRDISGVSNAMRRLKELGCRFALDDFGTGLSSFDYLKNLPVDCIKIDGMFVRDILKDEVDLTFVKSIIDIAKVMDIKTIAEHVETSDIAEKLTELGADYAQGYVYGAPKELEHLQS